MLERLSCVLLVFFFFSSRRRHTRFDCDWSSDVCSSDLVVSYSVTRRTREMGIRVALGAERLDVLGLILLQAAKLALTGEFLGILVALAVTRLMSGMLFGVSAADPLTFAGAVLLLTAVEIGRAHV